MSSMEIPAGHCAILRTCSCAKADILDVARPELRQAAFDLLFREAVALPIQPSNFTEQLADGGIAARLDIREDAFDDLADLRLILGTRGRVPAALQECRHSLSLLDGLRVDGRTGTAGQWSGGAERRTRTPCPARSPRPVPSHRKSRPWEMPIAGMTTSARAGWPRRSRSGAPRSPRYRRKWRRCPSRGSSSRSRRQAPARRRPHSRSSRPWRGTVPDVRCGRSRSRPCGFPRPARLQCRPGPCW